ncbi:MAG: prepilin-type N-terminal cleavage/methylation domain-containing protein [Candidatus Omnitrophota bacterium]|nr:prepilin-type N-terminal cleavage/methylation domain-containing protein [Candidatus Omnitrophota bacterium]
MRCIWKNRLGFSLVELLVVTAMLGIISLAIFSTFNNGLKVWQKINKPLAEEDLGIFFDKLTQDLSNCLKSAGIPFTGGQNNLGVPTLVSSLRLKIDSVGLVTYAYVQQSGVLNRQSKDFSQLYNQQEDSPVVLLKNIASFKFEYYYFDTQKQEYIWKEEWLGAGLPLAVRVGLSLNDSSGTDKITRTISIPIGG